MCTESLLWIFPQWQRAGQRHWGQHIEPRAHWQLLVWLWCTVSVQHTAFSLPPPPPLHTPASVFAQPERMLASHYADHPNFVSLQLFNGRTSVFVCFLTIRLLHLYGWSGGWNNPWHLFREGGVRKEPEVEAHFWFFILLSTRPCGPLFHPLPLRLGLWLYFEDKSDGRGYVQTGTGVTEAASYCRLSIPKWTQDRRDLSNHCCVSLIYLQMYADK